MRPTIGRIVLYMLTGADAAAIMERRKYSETFKSFGVEGNPVAEGDVVPTVVVREGSDGPGARINGSALLDGNDTFWVRSAALCEDKLEPGTWMWPVIPGRVEPFKPFGGQGERSVGGPAGGEMGSGAQQGTNTGGAGSSSGSADGVSKVTVVECSTTNEGGAFSLRLSDGAMAASPTWVEAGTEWPPATPSS